MTILDLIGEYLKDKQLDENDSYNVSDEQIVRWDFKYVPQPTMEELQALAPATEAKIAQAEINAKALAYLASTDWYQIRFIEEGIFVPEDILAKRAAARKSIIR